MAGRSVYAFFPDACVLSTPRRGLRAVSPLLCCSSFLRRFALGSSLWCVACFPCLGASLGALLLIVTGTDKLQDYLHRDHFSFMDFDSSWRIPLPIILMFVATMLGATVITAIHGLIVRRITLALFRLYVAAVSFCVGLISGGFATVCLNWHFHSWKPTLISGPLSRLTLSSLSRGILCFRHASELPRRPARSSQSCNPTRIHLHLAI